MLKSMTGFGIASTSEGATHVRVELKSVNHRFFEMTSHLPEPFMYLETTLQEVIRSRVKRGSVSLLLTIEGSEAMTPRLQTNWSLVDQYVEICKEIERRTACRMLDLSRILDLPGIFTVREADEKSASVLEPLVVKTVDAACDRLMDMRSAEGARLAHDLREKLTSVTRRLQRLEEVAPGVREAHERRLRQRVGDFLAGLAPVDEQRLLNEVAMFADKSAIDEELTRMKSHLEQFRTLLDDAQPAGRRMDFLIQEMNREMNTIGAKGNSAEISQIVVSAKSEIEKLREQVQNVE